MVDRRTDWKEGDAPGEGGNWTSDPASGWTHREQGLHGGGPGAWEMDSDPAVNRGMGYASPEGYQSPVRGSGAGREAVREYEGRRSAPARIYSEPREQRPGFGSKPQQAPDHEGATGSDRSSSSGAMGMLGETGLKAAAVIIGSLGLLFLAVWLVASINLQFGWPTGLFIIGLLLLGVGVVAWVLSKTLTNDGGGQGMGRGARD